MTTAHITSYDLNLLVSLQLLLETRNVTVAARRAGVTQSAMSRTLARLRDVFGDELFVRTRRGIVPTALALSLEEPARAAVATASRVFAARDAFEPRTLQRAFTVAGTDFAMLCILPALRARMHGTAPRASVVSLPLPDAPADALEAGTLDLAISFGAPPQPGLHWQLLFEDTLVCVARKGHPAFAKRMTLARYLELDHVSVTPHPTAPDAIDRALAKQRKHRRIALRTPHFLVAPAVLRSEDLVLTTGARVAHELARITPLAIADAPVDIGPIRIGQLWHDRHDRDPAHAWFRAQLKAASAGE